MLSTTAEIKKVSKNPLLDENVSLVLLAPAPNAYLRQSSLNTNYNEQLLRTIKTESSFFILDSLKSSYANNGFEVVTRNYGTNYNRMMLKNISLNLDLPLINDFNDTILIDFATTLPSYEPGYFVPFSLTVKLQKGYYPTMNTFIKELQDKINIAISQNSLLPTLFFVYNNYRGTVTPIPDDRRTIIGGLNKTYVYITDDDAAQSVGSIILSGVKKLSIMLPTTGANAADYQIAFNADCSFNRNGKSVMQFKNGSYEPCNSNANTDDKLISSGIAYMQPTRYIYIKSQELLKSMSNKGLVGYDGVNPASDLLAVISYNIPHDKATPAKNLSIDIANDYTILTRNNQLNKIDICLYDENNNVINTGYDKEGFPRNSQIVLTFICHD